MMLIKKDGIDFQQSTQHFNYGYIKDLRYNNKRVNPLPPFGGKLLTCPYPLNVQACRQLAARDILYAL